MHGVLKYIYRAARAADSGAADAELIRRFVAERDEASFAALVGRYGPLVWGACRRLLSEAEAEDAFQATFLVFATRAASISGRDALGGWLYGVARRTALQARSSAARRRAKEASVRPRPHEEASEDLDWRELGAVLDEEVGRLPPPFREAVVLCDLAGRTKRQAAEELCLPEGTVSSRLARGRQLLREQLTRRGLALPAAGLALLLSPNAAPACVPAALVSSTVRLGILLAAGQAVPANVATLTEGVLKTMLLSRLKVLSSLAGLLVALGVGLGLVGYHALAGPPAAEKPAARPADVPAEKERGVHYGRLIFGPKGETVALFRLEGDAVALDLDGDGKFTGKGERFKSEADVKGAVIRGRDGKTTYTITSVHVMHVVPPEKFVTFRVHVRGPADYHLGAIVQLAEGRDAAAKTNASKAYFHPDLTVGGMGGWRLDKGPRGKELVRESTLPASLKPGAEAHLDVHVYVDVKGGYVAVCSPDDVPSDKMKPAFPKGVHPVAEVEFPPKKAGGAVIRKRYPLATPRGDGGYRGTVRVPEEAGPGRAKVTFTFDAWKALKVAPSTAEIPVEDAGAGKEGSPVASAWSWLRGLADAGR